MEWWVGHFKYLLALNNDAFRSWAAVQPSGPEQLTEAKTRRLMLRLAGREAHPQAVERDGMTFVLNRLDFPEAEMADVMRGLRTFSQDPVNAAHAEAMCEAMPDEFDELEVAALAE